MKLKSKGSGPLIIRNAQLMGRKGISAEVTPGELTVVRSDAFNPLLTVEQLMKQSLARINRGGAATEQTWEVDCEELSFAADVDAFRLSELDLDAAVDDFANREPPVDVNAGDGEIDKLISKLSVAAAPGALVLAEAKSSRSSMSFRFDPVSAKDKVAEAVGELTREGAARTDLTFKVFSPEIRSRKELEGATPKKEFALTEVVADSPSTQPIATFRSLKPAERYRIGAEKWMKHSSARLLLLDSPRYLMSEKDTKEFVDHLRRSMNPTQMCLVFENMSVESDRELTSEQLTKYGECLLEFRRKRERSRLIDWIGGENELAEQFAVLPDARRSGLTTKDFIRKTTRYPCPVCNGNGYVISPMGPFGNLKMQCSNCSMTGFSENVLQVKHGEKTFRDVLCDENSLREPLALLSEPDIHTLIWAKLL